MTSRIVFCVEGDGDRAAVPKLVKRVLTDRGLWRPDLFTLDEQCLTVGNIAKLVARHDENWKRFLLAALKRKQTGAVLAVLDGDNRKFKEGPFCAAKAARHLADVAREVGAGKTFSLAVVIARQEYESWLIAGWGSLKSLASSPTRRQSAVSTPIPANPEDAPRDAKKWLRENLGFYNGAIHQAELTQHVSLQEIRSRQLRSFQRLEKAIEELVRAIQNNQFICTPS